MNLKMFEVKGSGYHATGMFIVVAETAERAAALANEAANKHYDITYYAMNTREMPGVTVTGWFREAILSEREYGFPELPGNYKASKWEGNKYDG